jgi:hypothetical protein
MTSALAFSAAVGKLTSEAIAPKLMPGAVTGISVTEQGKDLLGLWEFP